LYREDPIEKVLFELLEWPLRMKAVDQLDQIPTTIIEATVYGFVRQFRNLLDNSVTANIPKYSQAAEFLREKWSGRQDSNLRPPAPQACLQN